MQQLKLKTLTRQGDADPTIDNTIIVTHDYYSKLPILKDEELGDCITTKGTFEEIYRGHTKDEASKHIALIIQTSENDKMPWNIVWVENEALWIAFKYANIIDPDEAYGSTVEVANPQRGQVYKISKYVAELLRQAYNINVPLEEVYCNSPRY